MKPGRSSAWDRWIAALLLCYPRRFRARFGADLSAQYRKPEDGRTLRAAVLATRDLTRGGLGARLDDLRAAWSGRTTGSGSDGLLVDVRHSLRGLLRRPLFTLMVIATLALAASLNAAVFAILDTTLLRPLPVRDEASIVSIGSNWVGFVHSSVSVPEYLDYVERSRTLSPIAAFGSASFNVVANEGVPERVLGARVSASFFDVLGVAPALGRVFTAAEDRPGAPALALVSYGLWMRRFAGNPAVIGQTIRFDSGDRQIIGVMPREFLFPSARDRRLDSAVDQHRRALVAGLAQSPRHRPNSAGRIARAGARRDARDRQTARAGTSGGLPGRQRVGRERHAASRVSVRGLPRTARDAHGRRCVRPVDRMCERGQPPGRARERARR